MSSGHMSHAFPGFASSLMTNEPRPGARGIIRLPVEYLICTLSLQSLVLLGIVLLSMQSERPA